MAQVTIDQAALRRLLKSPSGVVGREAQRRADAVAAEARRRAPGSMSERIPAPRVVVRATGLSADVTCVHPAIMYVVRGTRRHPIRPIPPKKALRFTTGGRVVFARRVDHPGTRANDFLNAALRMAV